MYVCMITGNTVRISDGIYITRGGGGRLQFYAPQGRHFTPIGVEVSVLHHAKFHPRTVCKCGVEPQKLEILLTF